MLLTIPGATADAVLYTEEQGWDGRAAASDGYGDLQAVQGTRHVDVCEHHPDIRALLKDADRLVGLSRFQEAITGLLRNFDCQQADQDFRLRRSKERASVP